MIPVAMLAQVPFTGSIAVVLAGPRGTISSIRLAVRSVQVALLFQYAVLVTLRLAFLLAVGLLPLACCVSTLGLAVSAARLGS